MKYLSRNESHLCTSINTPKQTEPDSAYLNYGVLILKLENT